MKAVNLKGTEAGYQLILDPKAGVKQILTELSVLLAKLNRANQSVDHSVSFNVLTGNRLLSIETVHQIQATFEKYSEFSINRIISNVVNKKRIGQIGTDTNRDDQDFHVVGKTIRNGQKCQMRGDVLFLGNLHRGGELCASGNVYLMGDASGIVHAGFPNSENKLIIGDLHRTQQVRIGEQFNVVSDQQIDLTSQTLVYVNDLHVLKYDRLQNLKRINSEFYHQIGGLM